MRNFVLFVNFCADPLLNVSEESSPEVIVVSQMAGVTTRIATSWRSEGNQIGLSATKKKTRELIIFWIGIVLLCRFLKRCLIFFVRINNLERGLKEKDCQFNG